MELIRVKTSPKFTKTASQFLLGDNSSTYASELLAQLYRQHAFLGQYTVNLSIEGQDEAAGYLYGVFTVAPPRPAPMNPGQQMQGAQEPPPPPDPASTLRIPVIVDSRKAYSFDVFITPSGRFLPLSANRVASAMFEGSPYAAASQTEEQLRIEEAKQGFGQEGGQGGSGGNGGRMGYSMGKMGSVLANVVIPKESINQFSERLRGDQELMDALTIAPEFRDACAQIGKCQPPIEKVAAEDYPVDVAVFTKVDGGYAVRTATFDGGRDTYHIKNAEAGELPLNIRQRVADSGIAMATDERSTPLVAMETMAEMKEATRTGVYAVMSKTGSVRRAVVVTNPLMLDGRTTSSILVVGNDGASLQSKVAGIHCGEVDLVGIPGEEPRGDGLFLIGDRATELVNIRSRVSSPDGVSYLYEHPLLGQGQLKLASVRTPVHAGGADFLFPDTARFISMPSSRGYMEDAGAVEKIASRHDLINQVHLLAEGSSFSLRGSPLGGLVAENVPEAEALLLLGLLGDTADSAISKTASARKNGPVSFVAARTLASKPLEKVASAQVDVSSVRIDLVKEAAALAGSDTVDSVLSLNFITPENIQGYLNSMTYLEQAVQKLSELLVGVRLGLADVPESAVSASLSGVERALTGLKKLQIRVGMETGA